MSHAEITPTPSIVKTTWSPSRDLWLRQLLALKKPLSEIARIMALTKNAVIGRVHRQGYEEYARRDEPAPVTRNPFPGHHRCLWTDGDPQAPDFEFCAAPAIVGPEGKTGCRKHRARIYRPFHARETAEDVYQ